MLLGLFLVAIGIFCFWGAITKPSFFWDSRKALRLRKLIGDRGARIFYVILAVVIVVAGVVLGIMKMYENKADNLYDQGKFEEGLAYYKQLHEIFKDDISYLNGISFGNYMLHNFEQAKEYAVLSVSKGKKGNQDGNVLLAWSLVQQDQTVQAIEVLENYLANEPDDVFVLKEIGKLYFNNEQQEESIDSYKKAMDIDPTDGNIYMNLAEIYYQIGEFEKEIELYNQMIEGNIEVEGTPKEDIYKLVYYNLGVSYYSIGNYEKAKECFKESLEYDDSDADCWYFLASNQALLGEVDEVKQSLSKAFDLNNQYATIILTDADFASMLQDDELVKLIESYSK